MKKHKEKSNQKDLVFWKSQIDFDYIIIVIFKEHYNYDEIKKLMGDNIAVTHQEKRIFIDGEKLGDLNKDKIIFIEAHEIAHHYLGHQLKPIPEQEKEADYLAYLLLNKLNNKKASDLVINYFYSRHGEDFYDYEKRKGKDIKIP